jgi:hypothetical protein
MKKVNTYNTYNLQFFPLSVFIKKYNLFLCICNVNTILYRVKSSSLLVTKALFIIYKGKNYIQHTISLVPFFRLVYVIFYAHVSVQSGVNGGCEFCGKKDFPDEECMFSKNITCQRQD